ncbi:hypothetical protein Aperf_G00000045047 [Anoplocephala perfoliata]
MHPLYPVFAIAETNTISGKLVTVNYPSFQTKYIGKTKNTQVLHLVFSNQNLLACITSVPENTLTIWNFMKCELLIEAQLNFVCPDIFGFCPVNENKIVGATERHIYVWTLESYGSNNHITCSGIATPRIDARTGFYEEPQDCLPLELIEPEENPNIYPPVKKIVSGALRDSYDAYENYIDNAKRMKPISLTWTKEGFAIFGCRESQIFMTDLDSMALGVILNPQASKGTENQDYKEEEEIAVLKPGDVDNLIYTNDGLLCGGADGHLRLLDWPGAGSDDSTSIGLVAPTSLISQNFSSNFLSTIQQIALSKILLLNEESSNVLKSDLNGIVFMTASPDYQNFMILRKSGSVQILQRDKNLQNARITFKLLKTIRSNVSAFTGICSIDIAEVPYFVTCNSSGLVSLWFAKTGKQVCSMEFSSAATCVKALPGLPLTVIGFEDGTLCVVYWAENHKPCVKQTIQIFQSAVENIFMDLKGDVMVVKALEPNIYIIPCEPGKEFEPLGYITYENKIDSMTFARTQKDKIHCLILDKRKKAEKYTRATYFILTDEILNDALDYMYPNTYQLREEAISLISFKFHVEISSAYLFVNDLEMKKRKSAFSSASSLEMDRTSTNENKTDNDMGDSAATQIILYSLAKSPNENYNLITIDLTKEIADQISTHRQYARSALHARRSYSVVRDSIGRLQPLLQAGSNARRSVFRVVTSEALRYRVPRPSINLLQLTHMRKEEKEKKQKKEVLLVPKMTVTGVTAYHMTNVSFFYSSMSLCSTHLPGIVIALSQSGVLYILNLNDSSSIVAGYLPLTECTNLPLQVAVTRKFEILAVAKSDGSICTVNLADKISTIDEQELLAVQKEFELKLLSMKVFDSYSGTNSHNKADLYRHTTENDNAEDSEEFKFIKIDKRLNMTTWLEQQFENQRKKDIETLTDTKSHILEEFEKVKMELEQMAEKNSQLTDIEQVNITEFELDLEERNVTIEETNDILQKKRGEMERDDLIKDFTHDVIKSRCWDAQEVKGRSILAFDIPVEVSNYPLYPRTPEEMRLLNQAKIRRRIEMAIGAFYRRKCEKMYKKASSSESEKGSYESTIDGELVSETTDVHLGSVAAKFGISTELLYNQMELFTNDQKLTQATLIQDLTRKMRIKFNAEFDECLRRKRQYIGEIIKRVESINQIIPKLNPGAPILSLEMYKMQPVEEAESLLKCTEEEVDVDRYLSPEEIAAIEEAEHAEAERMRLELLDNWRERGLDDMMGGVLEVQKEDQLKKDVPIPYFVKAGKQEEDMSPEEKKIYKTYLQDCKELEEEREKYRKFLELEVKKNEMAIEEAKSIINEDVTNLFKSYLQYEIALKMEDLKVWKLRASILQARELQEEEKFYNQIKAELERKIEKLQAIIQQAKDLIEELQEEFELITVEDRLLEKGFRKDFHDVHGPSFDVINKAFKRRPKRLVIDFKLAYEDNVSEESKQRAPDTNIEASKSSNPYTEAMIRNRSLEVEWIAMKRALDDYDEANKMPEQNIDPAIWSRLYKARMKKAAKEMELKVISSKLSNAAAFLQRREKEMADAMAELSENEIARNDLKSKIYRVMTNVDVSIVMPQGQVEIELEPGALVEDFNSCLLINRKQIEDLNVQVLQLSNEKINHMELIKSYKRRFKTLEWDLREMLMRYEDLVDKQKQITNFTITREIQRYLQKPDYDSIVAAEINDSERNYAQLKANHQKNMAKVEEKIKHYSDTLVRKMKKENAKLLHELEEMNINVVQARHIYEQTPHATSDVLQAEACYKSVLRKVNLERLTLHQNAELQSLREELKQLHKENSSRIQSK